MPPNTTVDIPATDLGQSTAIGIAISGSVNWTGASGSNCAFVLSGRQVLPGTDAGTQLLNAGDSQACAYGYPAAYRLENPGPDSYLDAGLSFGTPFVDGMPNYGELFGAVGSSIDGYQIMAATLASVEPELLATSAVTLTIRQVTIPPGGRIVADDRYPAIRLISTGQLTWGSAFTGSNATPEIEFVVYKYGWLGWNIVPRGQDIVLTNRGDEPAVFVEWSVTPA